MSRCKLHHCSLHAAVTCTETDSHDCRYAESPLRFEAGTPAIAESIGLGAACDYLSGIGMARVQDAEHQLGGYLYEQVSTRC